MKSCSFQTRPPFPPRALILLFSVLFTGTIASALSEKGIDADKVAKVKAAYLYNFAKFVRWPERALAAEDSPIVIGIFGEDPFGTKLDDAVRGKKIGKRPFTILRTNADDRNWRAEIRTCHILHVADADPNRLSRLLDALNTASVLLVGEGETFARSGGMIGFALEEGRVILYVNRDRAEDAGLKLSADLLGVARIVDSEGGAKRKGN